MFISREVDSCIRIERIYSAFCAKRERSFSFSGEFHSFWELVYVLDGSVGVMADSRIYELQPGEIIFHKPFEFHRIWSAANSSPVYMVISFDLSGEAAEKLECKILKPSGMDNKLLSSLAEQISENAIITQNKFFCYGNNSIDFSKFVSTLNLLLVNCICNLSSNNAVRSENSKIFEKAVKYMEDNIACNLSNDDMAKYTNVSVSTLKRIFNTYSALSIHKYFLQLKIIKAQSLLKNGLSVCEVSELLGFSNQNNFSLAFKRITGIPPSKYLL